jgi:hypothetical protein
MLQGCCGLLARVVSSFIALVLLLVAASSTALLASWARLHPCHWIKRPAGAKPQPMR